jgi:hypothetical protein
MGRFANGKKRLLSWHISAYSGERDQPFRLKVITDSGDRDHAVHGRQSPA